MINENDPVSRRGSLTGRFFCETARGSAPVPSRGGGGWEVVGGPLRSPVVSYTATPERVGGSPSPVMTLAVILAAGQGTRMGSPINKVLLPIHGKPIILYSIETFEHSATIDEIMLVTAAGEEEQLTTLVYNAQCHKVRHIIRGGATRHASERCALEALRPRINAGEIEIVLIHDGARPFISVEKVEQLIHKARELGGAILATPLQAEERIVQVDSQHAIQKSFTGRSVWKAQTPQAFQAALLLTAYDQAERDQFYGTDTASSVERIGGHIAIIEGDNTNLKITTAHDLFVAEKLL